MKVLSSNLYCNKTMLALLCFSLLFITSCSSTSSKEFINNHPDFNSDYFKSTEIYSQDVNSDNFFILIGYRLSRDFEIERANLNDYFAPQFSIWFEKSLSSNFNYKKFSLESIKSETVAEKIQISQKVFISSNLPPQGKEIIFNNSKAKTILFLNEITLGANLKPEYLYDYEISNQDSRPKIEPKDKALSLITSYTLWDNEKQRVLQASVIEESILMPDKITEKDLQIIVNKTAKKISKNLEILK